MSFWGASWNSQAVPYHLEALRVPRKPSVWCLGMSSAAKSDPSEKKGKQQDLNKKTFVGAVLGQISTLFLFFFTQNFLKNTKTPTLGCNQETSASGISLNLKNDTCCADWQRQQSYLCSSAFPRQLCSVPGSWKKSRNLHPDTNRHQ